MDAQEIKFYNASAGGFYSMVSSDRGIFYLGRSCPNVIEKNKNEVFNETYKNNPSVYLVSPLLPHQIQRIVTTYSSAFIHKTDGNKKKILQKKKKKKCKKNFFKICKKNFIIGDIIIVGTEDYKDYSAIDEILNFYSKNGDNQKLEFPISGNSRMMGWSKENHIHFSKDFQQIVWIVLLCFKSINKQKNILNKYITVEILSLLSKHYY